MRRLCPTDLDPLATSDPLDTRDPIATSQALDSSELLATRDPLAPRHPSQVQAPPTSRSRDVACGPGQPTGRRPPPQALRRLAATQPASISATSDIIGTETA